MNAIKNSQKSDAMKKLLYFLICVFFVTGYAFSQDRETLAKLEQALMNASKGQRIYSLYPLIQDRNIAVKKILSIADDYRFVNNPDIQRSIASLYGDLALNVNDQKLKEKLINKMLDCCSDSMSLNYGCSEAIDKLKLFKTLDFNLIAQKKIAKKLNSAPDPYLILISGMLNLVEFIPFYKRLLTAENDYPKSFARKALARMGDQESIDFWVNQFDEQNPFNDFKLLETLLYIRQPVSIPIFEKLLFSEDGLDPEEPGGKGDPYASFGMYYLGLLLEDFPIPTRRNERSWDEANFALARQWMLSNKGKYKIRRDEF